MKLGIPGASLFMVVGLGLALVSCLPGAAWTGSTYNSFSIEPGAIYRIRKPSSYTYPQFFRKFIWFGRVVVTGEGIYLFIDFPDADSRDAVQINGHYEFVIDPDVHFNRFIFTNSGAVQGSVQFTLWFVVVGPAMVVLFPFMLLPWIGIGWFLSFLGAKLLDRYRAKRAYPTKPDITPSWIKERLCPHCHNRLDPEDEFCFQCGAGVQA